MENWENYKVRNFIIALSKSFFKVVTLRSTSWTVHVERNGEYDMMIVLDSKTEDLVTSVAPIT